MAPCRAHTHPPQRTQATPGSWPPPPLETARLRTAAARRRFHRAYPDAHLQLVTDPTHLTPDLVDDLAEVYAAAFSQPPYRETAEDVRDFRTRLARHAHAPGFRLALITVPTGRNRRPVAFGYGTLLQPTDTWWDHLHPDPHTPFDTTETGTRTFLGLELAVVPDYQGGVTGPACYDATVDQPAERITLAARADAGPAYRLYIGLGYRKVGTLTFPDGADAPAARYDALVLDDHPAAPAPTTKSGR